ncbi:hypothetical protein ACFFHH_08010 [Cytobacillus solani]|uniref:hypothetical protein n=1 Tax=Cytobacillus solani TaxID=1637975 RepID=UPI000B072266|nr:hypothetical protein [Cytobacillus solani]USK53469.1 hypothetical protein LIS82_17910 [Cytobacillus solani]
MYDTRIDFNKISQSLTDTIEAIKADPNILSTTALEQLQHAQNELHQAMSYSFSTLHK